MKIHVPSIPEEGKKIRFSQAQAWVQEMVKARFAEVCSADAACHGEVQLFRTNTNVTMTGDITVETTPRCSRCAQGFSQLLEVDLHRHLAPFFDLPDEARQAGSEMEIELNEDDLDFSTYHDEEIDLTEVLAEEVYLALPMRFLCQESCRGLCPQCGANWNHESCKCLDNKEKSPFSVLKDLKFPQK